MSHLDEHLECELNFVDEQLPVNSWNLDDLSSCPTVDLHSLCPESIRASSRDITLPSFPLVDPYQHPFDLGFSSPSVAIDASSPHTSPPRGRNAIRRDPAYVPRPRNAFMLFRIDFNARKQNQTGNLAQKDVSRLAGAYWRKLPETKKQIYKDMANREREIHKAKYPSYSYKYNDALNLLREPGSTLNQPNKSTELKFGAAVLTDGMPTPFGYDYSPIATWYLGEDDNDMFSLGGTKDLVGANVISDFQ